MLTSWGVERVMTADLGVDADVFRPDPDDEAATRAKLGIRSDARLLLYVGRLAQEKNVRTLLDAFEILHREQPGRYHLLCLGDGSQRPLVMDLREATGEVTWTPYCSDPHELAAVYRAADVFVHPGVQETFGLVTLESQASGTSVVGIRGSYMDRIIFSDQTHWACENTPEALAEAIRRIFTNDLRAEGLKASEAARSRYSWKTVFGRLFDAYEQAIASYSK
jgi:alpha-1,6-mannosyltransferase